MSSVCRWLVNAGWFLFCWGWYYSGWRGWDLITLAQFSTPVLLNFCSESMEGIKFWDPLEDSDTGGLSTVTVRWNTYLLFNSNILNFVWKTDEGEAESIVLLIFVLWRCFNRRWMRGGEVGHKVLIRTSWNLIFFLPGF